MPLLRLVYVSDATKPMSDAEIDAIVKSASTANLMRGITGLLLCSGQHFMQVLEGEWMTVQALYGRIASDPRHTNIRRLLERQTDCRLFPDWGMKVVNSGRLSKLDRERIDKVLLRLRLDANTGEIKEAREAIALLQEFREQLKAGAA